jgi:hypothetical protein
MGKPLICHGVLTSTVNLPGKRVSFGQG